MNFIARILMGLLGLGLLAGLLLALGIYIVFATMRWLLTGRKPQVVLVWQQFGALRRGARWGAGSGPIDDVRQPADDVVDVEVREVREDPSSAPHTPRLPEGKV